MALWMAIRAKSTWSQTLEGLLLGFDVLRGSLGTGNAVGAGLWGQGLWPGEV